MESCFQSHLGNSPSPVRKIARHLLSFCVFSPAPEHEPRPWNRQEAAQRAAGPAHRAAGFRRRAGQARRLACPRECACRQRTSLRPPLSVYASERAPLLTPPTHHNTHTPRTPFLRHSSLSPRTWARSKRRAAQAWRPAATPRWARACEGAVRGTGHGHLSGNERSGERARGVCRVRKRQASPPATAPP